MDPAVGPEPNVDNLLVPTFPTSRRRAKLEIRRACVAHESSSDQPVPSQYSLTLSRGYDANTTGLEFPKYNNYVESTVPNDSIMCGETTLLGTKCKHRASIGSSFCKKHRPQDGKEVTSPLNMLTRNSDEIKSPITVKVDVPESDEAVQCIGGDESCLEIPKKHSLYFDKQNIGNRSLHNLKTRIPGSNSASAPDIMSQPTVHDASTLGRLTDSQCSTVAEQLFPRGLKLTKPRPTNSEVLSVARSACCKASLQAGLEVRYGVLPEMMYFRAAKLCREQNIIVEWHQEGFVCPRGCKPVEKGHGLSQMKLLSDYTFKDTSSAVLSDWKMDESHCVLDSRHISLDISEDNITLCDDISFGLELVPIPCVIDENLLDAEGTDGFPFPWESFTYVMTPVLIDDAPGLHLESSQVGRDCGYSTCFPGTCDHLYLFNNDYEDAKDIYGKSMQRRFPYDERGRIILEEGYFVYECNQRCSCSRACQNRVLQNGVRVKLEVFKTENKVWAVRTREAILRGTFICEYVGEIIDENEANKRRARYGEDGCKYFYDIDAQINDTSRLIEEQVQYVIDATTYGNVSRHINHSCSANLASYQVVENNSKLAHIGLYASRDIAPEEELTYNFRYKMLPGDGCPCLCGSSNCRGRLY